MDKYETMKNSILKNIGELSEDLVDTFKVKNYYELIDLLYELWNTRAIVYAENPDLKKIVKEKLEKEVD